MVRQSVRPNSRRRCHLHHDHREAPGLAGDAGHAGGARGGAVVVRLFFFLLAGYYVLRPLRDQMGIAGGVRNLPWLFTATFVTLLVAQPLYWWRNFRARASSRSFISSLS